MGKTLKNVRLLDQKRRMRKIALERRAKLVASMNTSKSAELLRANVISLCKPSPKTSIAVYWPFRDEIDVTPLLNQLNSMGCNCLLPVIMRRKEPLQFCEWKPGDILQVSRFGTLEPNLTHSTVTPEILITPLLAFDSAGYRLGYGGGYYDRTLAELRKHFSILAIGAAYGCQKFESIPHDQFDQRLDAVVTEKGVHHISKD